MLNQANQTRREVERAERKAVNEAAVASNACPVCGSTLERAAGAAGAWFCSKSVYEPTGKRPTCKWTWTPG